MKKKFSFRSMLVLTLMVTLLVGCGQNEESSINYDCEHVLLASNTWETKRSDLNIYVSKGAVNGNGTFEHPFGTVNEARDFIRKIEIQQCSYTAINVLFREGVFNLSESLTLLEEDSGTSEIPIVYTSYNDEHVIFSGGVVLQAEEFKQIEDQTVLDRLDESINDKILVYDLSNLDVGTILKNGFGWEKEINLPELFVNHDSQPLSRYPNDGYLLVDDVVSEGFVPRTYEGEIEAADYIKQEGPKFKVKVDDEQLKRWSEEDELWTFGYWQWEWADDNLLIQDIDTKNSILSAAHPSYYGIKEDTRFYVYNALCEIDQPGEWYIDRQSEKLYYYPLENYENSTIELTLLDGALFDVQASNVIFHNLIFELTRGDGIQMMNANNNIVSDSVFRNIGSKAIEIGDVAGSFDGTVMVDADGGGGQGHLITGNQIFNTGSGGVYVIGGNREKLIDGNHIIKNNYFCNYARVNKTYSPAISLNGVGHKALNNEIHNGPHMAIQFRGNNMLIQKNEIYDVAKETSDVGVIYSVRDWTYRGNVIDGNFIHHIESMDEGEGSFGIYLDDMMSSTEIKNNIFYKMSNAAFLIGGGRDHYIHDNIIIDSNIGIIADARATNWAEGTASMPNGTMHVALNNSPYLNDTWKLAYPKLGNILYENYKIPERNTIINNVLINTHENDIHKLVKEHGIVKDNITIKANLNLMFKDVEALDFTIIDDSLIKEKINEFNYIDFKTIGK